MNEYCRAFADQIEHLSGRELADRARVTERTSENWRRALNGPSWRQTVTMLNDPVMRPLVLRAAYLAECKPVPRDFGRRANLLIGAAT